jgi:hypothetical protein
MAKAITEVAIGAAALGASFLVPGAGIAFLGLSHAAPMLASLGGSEIMAGFADALRKNQGGLAVAVTTPVGPWGYIYGRQKVGGVEVFRQSNNNTGVGGATTSNWKQLHRVYVLACHPCQIGAGWQLRIDGKNVPLQVDPAAPTSWKSYSPPATYANILAINRDENGLVTCKLDRPMDEADGHPIQITECSDGSFNTMPIPTQPDPDDATLFQWVSGGPVADVHGSGQFWMLYADYQDKIRVEFLDGNHTETFQVLLNAGTTWGPNDKLLGRTAVYVQMGYDSTVFPSSIPNVSFVIYGKNDILDPRSNTRGWTDNAALCIADYMSLPREKGGFGLAIGTDQPTDKLIAAANICDEDVPLAVGSTIKRYRLNTFFQLNEGRGVILSNLLSSCAGRLVRQQGQRFIVPGCWQSPTLELHDGDLIGAIDWTQRLSIRDTCNAVKGTYISPENGFQQGDAPMFMQNYMRGFGLITDAGQGDPWLVEDKGIRLFDEYNFPCTDDSATVQRLEKIALLRKRHQGRGTIRATMKAFRAVATDTICVYHPRWNTPGTQDWNPRILEVTKKRFIVDKSGEAPQLAVELEVADTGADIYDWNAETEELTPAGFKQTYSPATL